MSSQTQTQGLTYLTYLPTSFQKSPIPKLNLIPKRLAPLKTPNEIRNALGYQ